MGCVHKTPMRSGAKNLVPLNRKLLIPCKQPSVKMRKRA